MGFRTCKRCNPLIVGGIAAVGNVMRSTGQKAGQTANGAQSWSRARPRRDGSEIVVQDLVDWVIRKLSLVAQID